MSASKGYYTAESVALAEQQINTIRLTSDGRLMVDSTGGSGVTPVLMADNSATPTAQQVAAFNVGYDGATWDFFRAGITAAGTPTGFQNVLPGVQYLSAPLTLTTGQVMPTQADVNGNLKTVEQYAPVYEDNVIGVAVVEQRYTFTPITTATTTVIKSGAGFLHRIIWNKRIATGVTTIYDNTSAAGTKIGTVTVGAAILSDPPNVTAYNCSFATGLTIVTSQAEDITVVWR
jgi:hypothetical protein